MSVCISSQGEFGSHNLDASHVCLDCGAFDLDAALSSARSEGVAIAAGLLGKVVDYWDGRPVEHHGHHIYADLCDVLRALTPERAA